MMINTVCICGAGTMGSGIAQVTAQAGFQTILYDLNASILEGAFQYIEKGMNAFVKKGKMTEEEKGKAMGRILFTTGIKSCVADLFIEAIIEKIEPKVRLFKQLAELNNVGCIFASNTSSLSITDIASHVKNPERMLGMHFFNPAPLMKLVEVVKADQTSQEVVDEIVEVAKKMGKTPVVCKDSPGFIVNRVARPFYIEALRLAEEGISDFEQIDRLLETSGFRMGPFHLMDLIGNDINYAVSCSVYEQLNNPDRLKPSYIQEQKVKEGKLGKKTGEGYYQYSPK